MSRTPKSRRQKIRSGQYKQCRRGFLGWIRCTGEITNDGAPRMCPKCRGDGLIKVGGKGKGRPPGRGKSKRRRPRAGGVVVGAGAVWFGLGQMLGTVGYVLAAVLLAVAAVLWILGGVAQAFGLVTK